jgi:hypothetical protein
VKRKVASGFDPSAVKNVHKVKNVQKKVKGGKGGESPGARPCLCRMVGLCGPIDAITVTMAITESNLYHP